MDKGETKTKITYPLNLSKKTEVVIKTWSGSDPVSWQNVNNRNRRDKFHSNLSLPRWLSLEARIWPDKKKEEYSWAKSIITWSGSVGRSGYWESAAEVEGKSSNGELGLDSRSGSNDKPYGLLWAYQYKWWNEIFPNSRWRRTEMQRKEKYVPDLKYVMIHFSRT